MTDGTDAITIVHFALMAALAVLVVIGIVAGMRRKRRRVTAAREVKAHATEAGALPDAPEDEAARAEPAPAQPATLPTPTPAPASTPAPAAAGAPPVTPPPPPVTVEPAAPTDSALEEPAAATPLAVEPIAVAIAPDGTTAAIAADEETRAAPAPSDAPLTQLKGLGPKVAQRLSELGVDRVGQLAMLDDAALATLDANLGPFTGRMARDRWVEQARLLAHGDREGFERVFGKL